MRRSLADQFRTFRRVYVWWRNQLTMLGKVIFLVMLGTLPALADSGAILAMVFIASSVVLLVASEASYLYRPRLAIRATCPQNWMQRECRLLQLEVTNCSLLTLYDVSLEVLPTPGIWEIVNGSSRVSAVRPGDTINLSAKVKALRRGRFELPRLMAATEFPLRLVRRSVCYRITREALVLPFHHELGALRLAQTTPRFSRGNSLALQTLGLTGEYVGSREYQPGVPVRKWDYASWARLGQPVVREFSHPRHPSAAVILDTFFPNDMVRGTGLIPELEAILSLAASLTAALIAEGNRIDLLAIGNQLFACHHGFSGEDHRAVLEGLALAQPCGQKERAELADNLRRVPVTWDLAVMLSRHWGRDQESLLDVATKGCVTGTRIVVGPNGPPSDFVPPGPVYSFTCQEVEAGRVEL